MSDPSAAMDIVAWLRAEADQLYGMERMKEAADEIKKLRETLNIAKAALIDIGYTSDEVRETLTKIALGL